MVDLSDLAEAMPAGLFVYRFEPPDRLLLVAGNESARRLTGVDPALLEGRTFDEIWPEAARAGLTAKIVDVARTGVPYRVGEFAYADGRLDGAYCINAFAMPGSRVGVAFVDHTGRRRAEQARDRLFELSVDPILTTDLAGRILAINPAAERTLGWTVEELRTKPWQERVHPDDAEAFAAATAAGVARLGEGEPIAGAEARWAARDGSYRTLVITAYPVASAGLVYVVGRDVTEARAAEAERARLEAQLRHAQKMEAIGTLAGGIAHDFNNILTGLLGYAELAMEDAGDAEAARESIVEVKAAARRARDLVAKILAFSSGAAAARGQIALGPVVAEAAKLLRRSLPEPIELEVAIDPSCGPVVADPTEVHQIVMNLATNAYQAMWPPGAMEGEPQRLTIGLRPVTLATDEADAGLGLDPGPYLALVVADTGSGMDAATAARIFEPYFTTKEKGAGTGLGLSTVHGIVRSLGGGVAVRSAPGQGSTFTVLLPERRGASERQPAPEPADETLEGRERLLVVDDDEAVLGQAVRSLGRLGYEVTACRSGAEALEALASRPGGFDVVVTDLDMPRMTGLELARRVAASNPDLPLVLCTGFSERVDEARALAAGFRAFARKPLVGRDIARIVRRLAP